MVKKKKRERRESWQFIKTILCAPGTGVPFWCLFLLLGILIMWAYELCLLLCFSLQSFLSFSACAVVPPESSVFLCASQRCVADTIASSQQALEPLLFPGVITSTGCIYSNSGGKEGWRRWGMKGPASHGYTSWPPQKTSVARVVKGGGGVWSVSRQQPAPHTCLHGKDTGCSDPLSSHIKSAQPQGGGCKQRPLWGPMDCGAVLSFGPLPQPQWEPLHF